MSKIPGIGKRKAREIAQSGDVTIEQLRGAISSAKNSDKVMSSVNPAIPFDEAIKIYEKAIVSLGDGSGRKIASDVLIMTNIIRDCGLPSHINRPA